MCLITSQGSAFYMKSLYEFENTNMQSVCPVSWATELLSVPARRTKEDMAPQVALLCLFTTHLVQRGVDSFWDRHKACVTGNMVQHTYSAL